MGRLIDADKLLEETRKDRDYAEKNGFLDMYYERQALIDRIEAQPTAYDVEKVAELLEEVKNKDTEIALDEAQKERCFWYAQGMNRAIEIVKGGGVDAGGI